MGESKQTAGILNIQMTSDVESKENNLLKVQNFIEQNKDKKLDLVVLPEFFSTGLGKNLETSPEDANGGEIIKFLANVARKYNTNIACGSVIINDNGKLYNTCFVLNRAGEVVAEYRKINLFNYFGGTEGKYITPGEKVVVADLDFAKVGISICFDIRYPLLYNELMKQGAEIIVSPSAWCNFINADDAEKELFINTWQSLNIARAADNFVCFVTSNLCEQLNNSFYGIGNSMITIPSGKVLQQGGLEETALYWELDLLRLREMRQVSPISEYCENG